MADDAQAPTLFAAAGLRARALATADEPALQAFFEANPEYFLRVGDEPPRPDEARHELADLPPPHLPYSRQWILGLVGDGRPASIATSQDIAAGEIAGIAVVTEGLVAPRCWHVGLYVLATRLHGQGVAAPLFGALEDWARAHGALWLRLGVVRGNLPAERFWARLGFSELRVREGVPAGRRVNTVRVMLKPLASAGLGEYLDQVPRDRPGAELP